MIDMKKPAGNGGLFLFFGFGLLNFVARERVEDSAALAAVTRPF
jgi:hypothetical protein